MIDRIHRNEKKQRIFYDGVDVGIRRADFVVENQVIVELEETERIETDKNPN